MKIVISGGGTGGHIYPAIAIADKIKKENAKVEILFIGTKMGLENEIIPKAGYKFKYISVSYLKRKISLHNLRSALILVKGLCQARKILKEFKPDIVIGTGGFVSGPILYIASKMKIKTLIHEQNIWPGLTNRILSRYVDIIAVSFEESIKNFKDKKKIVVTGNPVREVFLSSTNEEANQKYKKTSLPLILVVGGSGGSGKLNTAVSELLKRKVNKSYSLLWVTGKKYYEEIVDKFKEHKGTVLLCCAEPDHDNTKEPSPCVDVKIVPYIADMHLALRACDVIICSAGAIMIVELTAIGKPAILVPKAHAADNHQEFNAKALENKGAAIMIKESQLTGEQLHSALELILSDKKKYIKMKNASREMAKLNALDKIYNSIQKLL
ncbi:MAG: undecaprenyldiphospho-muramoylpentapeptide beta-N-acetylglucosaminyltransferase [Alkaliphilus sp.]